MQDYRKLNVYVAAREFAVDVYKLTALFPADERYALTSQLRRAAVSVGANIVEGCSRETPADFARFLVIAEGSAAEAEFLIGLGHDLGMSAGADEQWQARLFDRVDHLRRMLASLKRSVRSGERTNNE